MLKKMRSLVHSLLWLLCRNWLTLLGASLTTFSAIAVAGVVLLEVLELVSSPYLGILAFLVLPGVFVLGLVMIPIGAIWQRKFERKHGIETSRDRLELPRIDFNNPRTRQIAGMVGFLSVVNIFVLGATTYKSVVYMESVEFCGQVCHTVMEPEYTAYLNSPHSRVDCVECHIGSGAPWFVRSKLSGVGQLFAVTFNTYEHPVSTPVKNLRPSRDICEECHMPEKFTGDRVRVITRYGEDEANTPMHTVLLMHIGGAGTEHGIHSWHIDPRRETTYTTLDPQRQEIAAVRVKEPDGSITEYFPGGKAPDLAQLAGGETRRMDCIDCHNRPAHIFEMPGEALDKALNHGMIDKTLPSIKKVAVEALKEVKGEEGDLDQIARRIETHFRDNHAELAKTKSAEIKQAIEESQAIYKRNVFPKMNVTWGTYINNISHINSEGCFRCHDGEFSTVDGSKTISQDCTICHGVLAMEEESPQVLTDLGMLDPQ